MWPFLKSIKPGPKQINKELQKKLKLSTLGTIQFIWFVKTILEFRLQATAAKLAMSSLDGFFFPPLDEQDTQLNKRKSPTLIFSFK